MKKVVFLPFLQISSGHHQAADSLAAYIKQLDPSIKCKKIDILHYTFGPAEKLVSNLYLWAIKSIPAFYSRLYRSAAWNREIDKRYFFYELLFLKSLHRMIEVEKPDLIVCTHSLPSHLANLLIQSGQLSVPVVNAYTDYFVNAVWGIKNIHYHLAPSTAIKHLLQTNNVNPETIFVTGIPVHPDFTDKQERNEIQTGFNVLVAGGNLGVGSIDRILTHNKMTGKITYHVLCGKNTALYQRLTGLNHSSILPLPYISCRKKMNELYDRMDLVLTKPGGITISECLRKRIPICLLKALPGQEELNEYYLVENSLVINKNHEINFADLEQSLLPFLKNNPERHRHNQFVSRHVGGQMQLAQAVEKVLGLSSVNP